MLSTQMPHAALESEHLVFINPSVAATSPLTYLPAPQPYHLVCVIGCQTWWGKSKCFSFVHLPPYSLVPEQHCGGLNQSLAGCALGTVSQSMASVAPLLLLPLLLSGSNL